MSESGDDKNRKSMIAQAQYERAMRTPVKLKTPIASTEPQKPQEIDSESYRDLKKLVDSGVALAGKVEGEKLTYCKGCKRFREDDHNCDDHKPKKRGPEFL